MARRFDLEKQRQWKQRIERQRASGLTVVRFCTEEGVSVKAFYYWTKRLGERTRPPHITPVVKAPEKKRRSAQPVATRVPGAVTNAAVVRFRLSAAVEVSVPADCLEVKADRNPLSEEELEGGVFEAEPDFGVEALYKDYD